MKPHNKTWEERLETLFVDIGIGANKHAEIYLKEIKDFIAQERANAVQEVKEKIINTVLGHKSNPFFNTRESGKFDGYEVCLTQMERNLKSINLNEE